MPKVVLFDEAAALQRATELFWEKGYNGTSMDELTKATGLSRSSIYNTFGDKHQLFMRSLEYYQQQQISDVTQAVKKAQTPMKKFRQLFKYAVDVVLKDPLRKGCMAVNATTEMLNADEQIANFLFNNMDAFERTFRDWIKEGQTIGEITDKFTATALARHIFNTYSGLRVSGQTKPDRKVLEDIVNVALSALEK